jgi:hypothetical protein
MRLHKSNKIEFIHLVDIVIDQVGEKIEAVYPLLAGLDPMTEEYQLLNRLWLDWCSYIEA